MKKTIKENIEIINRDAKIAILDSHYKGEEMFVISYKYYMMNNNEETFFIAQLISVGKINSRSLTINTIYDRGILVCNILMQGVHKIGEFILEYSDECSNDFISGFYFDLNHHLNPDNRYIILGEYKKLAARCHQLNYKSRSKMIKLEVNEEKVKEYLMLCKEKNWDCNYLGEKTN